MKNNKKAKKKKRPQLKTKVVEKKPSFKKWIIVASVILILIVLIFILFQIGIKTDILSKNNLYIGLEPSQKIVIIDYDKPVDLNFTLKNHNLWFCKTYCEFSLYDPNKEMKLTTENITLNSNSEISKTYSIIFNTQGEGQRIYYFEAECNNIRTILCQTDEKKVLRLSFVAINYNLPESEVALRDTLKDKLNAYSSKIDDALILIEENELIISNIIPIKPIVFETEKEKKSITTSLVLLEKLQTLWYQDKYTELNELFSPNDTELVEEIITQLQQKKENNLKNINSYNSNTVIFNNFKSRWEIFNEAFRFYLKLDNITLANNVKDLSEKIEARYLVFNTTSFEDFHQLEQPLVNLNASFFEILERYELDKNTFQSLNTIAINTHSAIQSKVFDILGSNHPNLQGEACNDLRQLSDNYKEINTNAEKALEGFDQYLNNTEFITLKDAYKKSITEENFTVVFDNATNKFIINESSVIENTLNLTKRDYVSVLQFNDSEELERMALISCKSVNQNLSFSFSGNYLNQINITPYNKKPIVNIEFKNNPPKCCIFNSCSNCSTNESLYPTIFVHGHSSLENNPVEQSLMSFSKIQKKMGYEDNFINVGDIDITTAALSGGWSRMNYPITVKASYYYVIYYDLGLYTATVRKSESIENYAIRLKEIIDIVKANTGAAKVNLVGHSMGGLVAREYISIFGDENVDKLVVIGTPNHGISGRARQFCSTLGSDKECEDMYKESIFLKKLNSETNIPKNIKVYVIYGSGCNTDGKDGDGAIAAEDVILDYAENYMVKGKCEDLLGVELHGNMLDPEIYPEVYHKLVEILKS